MFNPLLPVNLFVDEYLRGGEGMKKPPAYLRALRSGKGYQPLTAPIVIPFVKYFWNMMKIMTIGTAPSVAPAMIRP